MTPFEWSSHLLTHPDLDDDHREIVSMLSEMDTLYSAGTPSGEESISLMTRLLDKVVEHVKVEEALMHKTAYARFIPHKIEHDHFRTKLQEFLADLKKGTAVMDEESTLFIRTWLYEHISSVDKAFAKWLEDKGLA